MFVSRSPVRVIAVPLLAVFGALIAKLLLSPLLPAEPPFLLFFTSIVISAWAGGIVPGVSATFLGAVLARYFFMQPVYSLALQPDAVLQIALFCFEGFVITTVSYRLHTAYAHAVQEIADHERTEQSLRESEERFRLLVEGVKDYAIFMLDPQGKISLWNSGAERIKGYTADEIIGRPWASLYPPELAAKGEPQALMQKAIENGSVQAEGWRMRKDGTRFWANITLTSLWKNGELRGFAKVTRDMTEARRANELANQLEREQAARREAEHANRMKTQFLGMISHELRTPLTSMKGFTTSLLASDVHWTPEQQRQFLEIIDQEADKLHELIEQLLGLSQIQSGMLQIRVKQQPLEASVDLARLELQALTRNHDLKVDLPPDLGDVMIDERRIAQVLVNLVNNSVKYAPPGTEICLTATEVDSMLQVEVHDEGPGIPVDRRETIFEAFNQLEQKSHPKDGVGLGLAICRGLVHAHGGQIWVKNQPLSGATFVFTVPLAEKIAALDDA